jgi:hypothetical protein
VAEFKDPVGLLRLVLASVGAEPIELEGIDVLADICAARQGDVVRVPLNAGASAWLVRYGGGAAWTLVCVAPARAEWCDLDKVDRGVFFAGPFPAGFVGKRAFRKVWQVTLADSKLGDMCCLWEPKRGKAMCRLAQIGEIANGEIISVYLKVGDHTPVSCEGWRTVPILHNREGAQWLWENARTSFAGYFGFTVSLSAAQKRLALAGLCEMPLTAAQRKAAKALENKV